MRLLLILTTAAIAFAQDPAPRLPTLWITGDSTANNTEHRGWGEYAPAFFDAAKVTVVNRARAGRSSRTFQTEGLWQKVMDDVRPGDFVLIQFGHNDSGAPDKDRARGSLPGTGEESKEFTLPSGTKEVVHTFGWYLRKMIADVKAKHATPFLAGLTVRNIWKDGKVERGSGRFNEWAAEVAKAAGVQYLDVTTLIADQYEKLGEEKVKELFSTDHTHTSPAGAEANAAAMVATLKGLRDGPFIKLLSPKGLKVAAYSPFPKLNTPARADLPTLFLIGDSTVRNGNADGSNGQWGWGEPLVNLFDATKINVVNRAVGGLSSRTFFTLGHWERVLAMLKPGDFVVMQFGHNDPAPLDDMARARGTLPGTGDETREIDNPITGQHETVHTYGWYLRQFIAGARAHGATPIVCTLVPRKTWKDGHIVRSRESFAGWAAQVAASEHAPLLDLNEIIARRYDALGAERVESLFGDPHTHTSRAGAELNAECVVAALKGLKPDPLEQFFNAAGAAVKPVQ